MFTKLTIADVCNSTELKVRINELLQSNSNTIRSNLINSSELETRVTKIVNNEIFINTILGRLDYDTKIRKEVDKLFSDINKLKQYANSSLNSHIIDTNNKITEIKNYVTREIDYIFSNKIKGEVSTQLRDLLFNDNRVAQIKDTLILQITTELETHVRQILHNIVTDPQYHQINNMYFNEFTQKGNNLICNYESVLTNDRETYKNRLMMLENTITNRCEKNIDNFNNKSHQIDVCENRIKELENKLNNLTFFSTISSVIFVGFSIVYFTGYFPNK